jgi:leucyl-tRNA synthetase
MGDYGSAAPWSENGVKGCKRFLDRFADVADLVKPQGTSAALETSIHKTIKKVNADLEDMKFNTAIAAMMGLLNEIYDAGSIAASDYSMLVRLLCPIAPHLCEELWESMGGKGFCSLAAWPEHDEAKTVDQVVELPVQICGKVRGKITVATDASKDEILTAAKAQVAAQLEGKTIIKEIVVPGKLVSLVVK